MKKHTLGFSLIELMIVIALIAILMSIALPSYQHYLQRAEIAEGFSLASSIQMAANEWFYETGRIPRDLTELGILHSPQGKYVHHIEINQGAIHIVFGNQASEAIKEKIMRLIPYINPDQSLVWRCQTGSMPPNVTLAPGAQDEATANDLPLNVLPHHCRS